MQLFRCFDIKMQFGKSVKPITTVIVLSFVGAGIACEGAQAKAAHKGGSTTARSSDGVVVRKNADGTVEAYDTGSSPEPMAAESGSPVVHRSRAPRAYSRTIGGVHVKKNADGTVETYEGPSPRVSLYPSQHVAAGKSGKAAHHRKAAGGTSSGDVKVKRNSDGTVETSDN